MTDTRYVEITARPVTSLARADEAVQASGVITTSLADSTAGRNDIRPLYSARPVGEHGFRIVRDFFWTSGHLGWGFFAIVVFSGLWLLLSDLVWRLRNMRIVGLALAASAGWVVAVALIVAGFYLAAALRP